MKKLLQFKNIFAMLAGLMFSIILVCLFISINNYSLAGTVSMEGNAGVIMYVNGEYVEFDKSTNSYKVTQDCEVTITIINDNKIANNEEGKPIISKAPSSSPVKGNTPAEITQETKERIAKARNRREIKRIKLSEELESAYGLIDYGTETVEESKLQESVINDNVNTSGAVTMNNVSEFMDLFSEDEKLKLANLKANNGLNYVCQ